MSRNGSFDKEKQPGYGTEGPPPYSTKIIRGYRCTYTKLYAFIVDTETLTIILLFFIKLSY